MSSKNMKSSTQLLVVLFWIIGIVIAALAITGIPQAQNPTSSHLFIVILVLVIFMGMVSLANCLLSKGNKDNYEVNDAEKGGKENTAFDNESDSKKDQQQQQQQNGTTAGTSGKEDEKWVQNYVPFGDYPKGNIVYVKEYVPQDMINELNGVEVLNEEQEWQQQNNKNYYN